MRELDIHNPFGAPVYWEDTVSSTMDIARRFAQGDEPSGTVIAAGFQEAGRGRMPERSWLTERDQALLFTILLRYPQPPLPRALTLRAGLAVSLGLEDFVFDQGRYFKNRVMIKWPNDIWLGDKKAAGILCESDGRNVLIGVGINFFQTAFPPDLSQATSIALNLERPSKILKDALPETPDEELQGEDRFTLLEHILERLAEEFSRTGDEWRRQVEQRLYKRGWTVEFVPGAPNTADPVEGKIQGIGEDGELLFIPSGEAEARAYFTGELPHRGLHRA
jgi:BirA family biotin operon repressor/biotin-[acetyl-CoA-carboxylase] ligase